MAERYGVMWPDGSITGSITDKYGLAAAYAKSDGGKVYTADAKGNPLHNDAKTEKEYHEPDLPDERATETPAADRPPMVESRAQGAFTFLE